MVEIVIVQHGEKRREPGDPGLTDVGHRQAQTTADWLAERARPIAVMSSPLRRARETAAPIAELFDCEVTIDERVIERINWDGSNSLEEFLATWARTTEDRSFEPPYGDSSSRAGARFLDAMNDLSGKAGCAIVVAHGGVTVDLLRTVLGDDVITARWPDLLTEGVPNCAITRLVEAADGWAVEAVASVAHLATEQPLTAATTG